MATENDRVVRALDGLSRDLAHVGLDARMRLVCLADGSVRYPRGARLEPKEQAESESFGADGFVLRYFGSLRRFDHADPAQEACITAMIDSVQDDAMDELGFGWPEVSVDGVFRGLLSPMCDGAGCSWALADRSIAGVGDLGELTGYVVKTRP